MMAQCAATVYHRDEYRYSGRGSSGFTMHYQKAQCTREALPGKTRCWQHDPDEALARMQRSHERRLAKRARLRERERARKAGQ